MKNNLLEKTCFQYLADDGWVMTLEKTDYLTKWILENKKYRYRDFIRKHRDYSRSGFYTLIKKLQINQDFRRILLPYDIKN